jgi:hypothetical protein
MGSKEAGQLRAADADGPRPNPVSREPALLEPAVDSNRAYFQSFRRLGDGEQVSSLADSHQFHLCMSTSWRYTD